MINNNINFEQEIDSLHEILSKRKIKQDSNYLAWKQKFILIYGKNHTDLKLYISYSLIFLATIAFIFEYILPRDEEKEKFYNISSKSLIELNKYLKNKKNFEIKNEISYFVPLIEQINEVKPNYINTILNLLEQEIINYPCAPEYKLDLAFQGILSSELRHGSGEFYTPPFLVKKMVSETYNFGDKTLDPCCGSGNFIIEIIRQILNKKVDQGSKAKAIENVYGCDINPFSTYLTKLNLLFLTNLNFANITQNIFNYDFLLGENSDLPKNFDLIIGNPPWYTLRDIESVELQNAVKLLSERLEIKPSPKNVLNIEMASLFFYLAKNKFLRVNGTIFFVMTKGVITGSHAARFRAFKGFKNIKVWRFNNLLETTFNIDFVCIFAQKASMNEALDDFKIPVSKFNLDKVNQKLNYFDNLDLIEESKEILIPYSIEKKDERIYVKKFIEEKKLEELLPLKESYYKRLFHKGADLNPRSLIFVKSKVLKSDLVEITPDSRIFKKAKVPWDRTFFNHEYVEKDYIFKVVKSTELVKFFIYDDYEVFLPLKKSTLKYSYEDLKEKGKLFYDKINKLYLSYKKDTTNHTSLMDNLDRWSKLINQRQRSNIKVVYNNSGSIVNSAVIQGDVLITGDLSFYATENLEEAYYLSSILNSEITTKQIKIKKSSRHIFKLPFELPIKKFNYADPTHRKLAELGEKAEIAVKGAINSFSMDNHQSYSKKLIQSKLRMRLKPIMDEINKLTLAILSA